MIIQITNSNRERSNSKARENIALGNSKFALKNQIIKKHPLEINASGITKKKTFIYHELLFMTYR